MNKRIIILGMSLLLVGGGIVAYPTVDEYIRAKYDLPVRVEGVYEVNEENRKYERLDYLYELVVTNNYESNIYLRFPDVCSDDDSNLVNINVDDNEYYIIEDGHKTEFESRDEIIDYLWKVGLL